VYLDNDRRSAMTPQLAFRVAIIGGVALVAFAVIFFRLWYLQVLSGDKYEREAQNNQLRLIKVQAPRGQIVDRDGRVLVDNRPGLAVKVSPDRLPEQDDRRRRVYRSLGRVLGVSPARIERSVERQLKAEPFSAATVKQDVPLRFVSYLLENQRDFPGVTVEQVFLREYPHQAIGAHLFGYVGEVTQEQLDDQRYRGVTIGDRVGQSGIEYQYDRFLRGTNGASRVQVDALGNLRQRLGVRAPRQGRQLRLSVDLDVQEAGQRALGGAAGAFVVMNVDDGQVLALGSSPSFDPNVFSKAVRKSDYDRLTSKENGEPLANRATQGLYPTGSTFKLITAAAALEGGLITPGTVQYDPGSLRVGGVTFRNAGDVAHGALALRKALSVSSDVFFYKLGQAANGSRDPLVIQKWARRLGLGQPTGIDLPGEAAGLVPTPRWRDDLFRRKLTDRPWSVGDNINLSVGQGDLQADPLQMAVAYATIANGGRVVTPRLGLRIENPNGRVRQQLDSPSVRRLNVRPEFRQAILDGLRSAASESGGTSTPVFEGFPVPVAGKTGTAEKGLGRADQSWYLALAPYPDPKYVVAVTFEAGGFGAETAAPAARQILQALFDVRQRGPIPTGSAPD
jgi:penicillin-binding protein 2